MAILYVMIGIPGSGKSIYAKNIPNTKTICSNDIRYELTKDYSNMTKNNEVFEILEEKILKELKKNNNVVYDATNLFTRKRREITEKFISEASKIIYIFMDTPLYVALDWNEKRERKVPEDLIKKMHYLLQPPTKLRDNYDKLIIVKPDGSEEIKNGIKE